VIIIVIAAIAFLTGVIVGIIALLRAGIAREERDHSLRGEPATRAARAARRVVRLYVRMPERVTQADDRADHRADASQRRWSPTGTQTRPGRTPY
jgi:hypothetical protein